MKLLSGVSLLTTAALFTSAALQAAPGFRYVVNSVTVTDLGTLGGRYSQAMDINDRGRIVGISSSYAGVNHGFLYRDGILIDVGASAWSSVSEAMGINNSDIVVGTLWEGENGNHAFRWEEGVMTRLTEISSRDPWWWLLGSNSEAIAISDTGHIAGSRYCDDVPGRDCQGQGTVWTNPTTIHHLDTESTGFGIDLYDINGAYVVGYRPGFGSDSDRRWRFDPSVFPAPSVVIPGTGPSVPRVTPTGVNRLGAVTGYVSCTASDRSVCLRAIYWNGTSAYSQDLGVLPSGGKSAAQDINNAGFITGVANRYFPDWSYWRVDTAFFYHRDFGIYELPKLPATTGDGTCSARALNNIDVNNRVQVVGNCQTGDRSSTTHAVRWDVTLRKVSAPCPSPAPC